MADEKKDEKKPEGPPPTKFGKFIQTYSGFLSSFVIGVAGLIATSIWQYRQSEIARRQAESQQRVAETQANNAWRVERAEILSKNLQVLSSHEKDTLEQRYGVLLSLTRGQIIDPELAVSYALELGKENPDYMRTVLASTSEKNYLQLAHAFVLTCLQRFGVAKDADICKGDRFADRSDTIAQLINDEMDAINSGSNLPGGGPATLLKSERDVQAMPDKLAWMFEPYLQQLYDRRQWDEIKRFEKYSTGAHLVSALVLATARTGEFVTSAEAANLDKFHADERRWLTQYLLGPTCDGECKGRLVDVMLSSYGEAQGDYDEPFRKLLERPRSEAGPAVGRLHGRLLWCQMDASDEALFRDKVLVPALDEVLKSPKPDAMMLGDLAGLLALTPEAQDPGFKDVQARMQKMNPTAYQKTYVNRRAIADRERRDPPPAMRNVSFCGAAEVPPGPPPPPK
jgi:hypothetical protein